MDPTGQVSTLFNFPGGANGSQPQGGLTLARDTLFGTADGGEFSTPGYLDAGVVFSVGEDGSNYTILHQFNILDGSLPVGLLQQGPYGGFFGITSDGGGLNGYGVLYYVQPHGAFKIAHIFTSGADGRQPNWLLSDSAGNLFGTTRFGGSACPDHKRYDGCGVVYEYQPAAKTYTILHAFQGGSDGSEPMLGSIGPDGTLYGVTTADGGHSHGTLFSLVPAGVSSTVATLAAFGDRFQGEAPAAGPTLARDGTLFGATPDYLYSYRTGRLKALLFFTKTGSTLYAPFGQLTLSERGTTLYGTAGSGGVLPCPLISPYSGPYGCGGIYSYGLAPTDH